MTLHLPPLFTILGVLAATAVMSYIVFGLCMLWGFSSDWGPRLAVFLTPLTAVLCWIFFWRLA